MTWYTNAPMREYVNAAVPPMPTIPIQFFSSHNREKTGIYDFDLRKEINVAYPATSPNLLASFIVIRKGDSVSCVLNSTSNLFFIIEGSGTCKIDEYDIREFNSGDILVVPHHDIEFITSVNSKIYWVNDSPLLNYLNVDASKPKHNPLYFSKAQLLKFVDNISVDPTKNRTGILLGNFLTNSFPGGSGTLTVTNTLWCLLNILPGNTIQKPHRHNSVAIDLCVAGGSPSVYTMMGKDIDASGNIKDPIRCEWTTGCVFTTPPGYWHSHHNDGVNDAYVLPVQDAGLYTYQRTLDIQFIN